MIDLRVLYIVVHNSYVEYYLKEITIDSMNMISEFEEDGVKINQNISSIKSILLFKSKESSAKLEQQCVGDLSIDKVVHVTCDCLK